MNHVRDLHERAMTLADEMLVARARGRTRNAEELAREAFHMELRAATMAFDRGTSAATRIILLRSAANLAREAREWEAGMDLAIRALNSADLREYRTEIFRIVETLRTYEHLSVTGIKLADTDVQMTIAGPDAAPDFARSDEVLNRVEKFRILMIRSAMRSAGIPFKDALPRTHQFKNVFTPYISQSRAASFAVTLRFGIDEQQELSLFEDIAETRTTHKPPQVSKVLEDVLKSARAYAEGGPTALQRLIADEPYARNAATLLRELSPDSKRIETVGFTIIRRGKMQPVALPERDAFAITKLPWFAEGGRAEALPPQERIVVGRLLAGNAVNVDRATGSIVDDDGTIIDFRYDEATHGDVIDDYWKHRVSARLRRVERGYLLLTIDNA